MVGLGDLVGLEVLGAAEVFIVVLALDVLAASSAALTVSAVLTALDVIVVGDGNCPLKYIAFYPKKCPCEFMAGTLLFSQS